MKAEKVTFSTVAVWLLICAALALGLASAWDSEAKQREADNASHVDAADSVTVGRDGIAVHSFTVTAKREEKK